MKSQTVGDLMRTLVKRYNLVPERDGKEVAVRARQDAKIAGQVERQASNTIQEKVQSLERENQVLKANLKSKESALEKKVE